jgi:hypothetical protein
MRPLFQLFVKNVFVSPNIWVSGIGLIFINIVMNRYVPQFLPGQGQDANNAGLGVANPNDNLPNVGHGVPNPNGNANPNVNAPHAEQEQPQGQEQINNFENFNAFHNNYNVFEYLR